MGAVIQEPKVVVAAYAVAVEEWALAFGVPFLDKVQTDISWQQQSEDSSFEPFLYCKEM